MLNGFGSIFTYPNNPTASTIVPPFAVGSAFNGLSVDPVTGKIQLGDDTFLIGSPGEFVIPRFLNLNNFDLAIWNNAVDQYLLINPGGSARFGDVNGTLGASGLGVLEINFGSLQANLLSRFNGGHAALFLDSLNNLSRLGDVNSAGNNSMLTLDDINRFLLFTSTGARYLSLDASADTYSIGDMDNATGGSFIELLNPFNAMRLFLRNFRAMQFVQQLGNNRYDIGDLDATDQGAVLTVTSDLANAALQFAGTGGKNALDLSLTTELFRIGGLGGFTNSLFLEIDASATNRIMTNGFNQLIGSNGTNYANNAAANVGTLNNAPAAGNPTKWIPINDNGTIRNIPAW